MLLTKERRTISKQLTMLAIVAFVISMVVFFILDLLASYIIDNKLIESWDTYSYKVYVYTVTIQLVTSFAVFFIILLYGVRKIIMRIKKLRNEVGILEGGNLDFKILAEGNDELTDLSLSIESLRQSIIQQFERGKELTKLNSQMITDLSHDIRTPLTAISIYSEAIKLRKYKDEAELLQYLGKIEAKLEDINCLSERLFKHALAEKVSVKYGAYDREIGVGRFRDVLYEPLSAMLESLSESGFFVGYNVDTGFGDGTAIDWEQGEVEYPQKDINRIVNNIQSNILKFADRELPVKIDVADDEKYIYISFENVIRDRTNFAEIERTETDIDAALAGNGRGVGLANIKKMMEKANGKCEIQSPGNCFKISLAFKKY